MVVSHENKNARTLFYGFYYTPAPASICYLKFNNHNGSARHVDIKSAGWFSTLEAAENYAEAWEMISIAIPPSHLMLKSAHHSRTDGRTNERTVQWCGRLCNLCNVVVCSSSNNLRWRWSNEGECCVKIPSEMLFSTFRRLLTTTTGAAMYVQRAEEIQMTKAMVLLYWWQWNLMAVVLAFYIYATVMWDLLETDLE